MKLHNSVVILFFKNKNFVKSEFKNSLYYWIEYYPLLNILLFPYSRRHSLPNGNGCIVVPLKETNTTTTTDSSRHEDEEDDDIDEEISETAALTAV